MELGNMKDKKIYSAKQINAFAAKKEEKWFEQMPIDTCHLIDPTECVRILWYVTTTDESDR